MTNDMNQQESQTSDDHPTRKRRYNRCMVSVLQLMGIQVFGVHSPQELVVVQCSSTTRNTNHHRHGGASLHCSSTNCSIWYQLHRTNRTLPKQSSLLYCPVARQRADALWCWCRPTTTSFYFLFHCWILMVLLDLRPNTSMVVWSFTISKFVTVPEHAAGWSSVNSCRRSCWHDPIQALASTPKRTIVSMRTGYTRSPLTSLLLAEITTCTSTSRLYSSRRSTSNSAPEEDDEDMDDEEEDEEDDVPPDWSEADLLAEFADVVDEDDVDGVVAAVLAPVETGGNVAGVDTDDDDDDASILVGPTLSSRDTLLVTNNDDEGVIDVDEEDEDIDEVDLALDEDDDDDEEIDEEDYEDLVLEETVQGATGVDDDEWAETYNQLDENLDLDDEGDDSYDGDRYSDLIDDPDDSNYMRQKELVEEAIRASQQRRSEESFDVISYLTNQMTPENAAILDQLPFLKAVEERAKQLQLTEDDVQNIDFNKELAQVSDPMDDDPYPRHETGEVNHMESSIGLSDDIMEKLDETYKEISRAAEAEPWDKVVAKDLTGWDGLSNKTITEMEACLEEIGGSAYNVTKWLLYDLDFNVSNLILAAVKHNKEAPILFQHWYPQLATYERYQAQRDRNFDFSWDDVEAADIEELERYYAGFGYSTIPKKAPAETGIISLEDLDEEEIKMAAFENWMTEVYNPEMDRKDFDDDDMQDGDNVYSEFYEPQQHPDLPSFDESMEDLDQWREDMGDDEAVRGYRDMMGRSFDYKVVRDEEFEREFRGHLIIACTADDSDLEVAEKITLRFEREFGKKVFVETRVLALARKEDNVFEIWLESYEVDLLHSKKRATSNTKAWDGPAEVDDTQIDFLVDRVAFLISDDARYSYRYDLEMVG